MEREPGEGTQGDSGAGSGRDSEESVRALTERYRARRFAEQWRELLRRREEELGGPELVVIEDGRRSNFGEARVPYGIELAASWSWRLIVIAAATYGVLWLLGFFAVIVFPIVVALLIACLVSPFVDRLERLGVGRRLAALITVVLGLGVLALLITFVSTQVANGFSDLETKLVDGIGQVQDWLRTGPLKVSDADLQNALKELQTRVGSSDVNVVGTLAELGATVGHVVAGIFIALFATYFFLADGALIWSWVVRIFPRGARGRADSSGRVAWHSLTQFTRATVVIAATDAIGIAVWAAVLNVPLVTAIGVLVFIGAFVPMIGATVSGAVAVLVALVAGGPVTALLMLAGVIVVQQLEAHVLQPFLMGRFVSVHPLGVIVAIGAGVLVAGVAGALVAVPLAAALNAVVQHLAAYTGVGEDAEEAAEDDPATPDPDTEVDPAETEPEDR